MRDDEKISEDAAEWESFVLRERGTFRDVKRFANRARFLTSVYDQAEGAISEEELVGFVALEECGAVDRHNNGFDFDKWRRAKLGEGFLPRDWAENVGEDQWKAYKAIVGGGRGYGRRVTDEDR